MTSPRPGVGPRSVRAAAGLAVGLGLAAAAGLAGCRPGAGPVDEPGASRASDAASTSARPLGVPPRDTAGATIALTEADAAIAGRLPAGAVGPVSITLRAADGRLRAGATADVEGRTGRWSALLVGPDGTDVAPRPGDRVRAVDRDGSHDWTVPPLVVRFGRGSDVVSGTTAAGASVAVTRTGVRRGTGDGGLPAEPAAYAGATARPPSDAAAAPPSAVAVTAGADGAFTARLGAGVALRGDDEIRLVVDAGGMRWNARRRVPFLRVAIHPGEVTVFLRPLAPVTLTLVGPGGRSAAGRAVTDRDGRATVWLHDAAFRRLPPARGDTVAATDGETALALRVPDFAAGHDLAAGVLSGIGTPGDAVDITLWNPWFPGEIDEPRTVVGADGRWQVTSAVGLHPASHYYVTEVLPGGDRLFRCYQVPMLHVTVDSAVVGIQALTFADARLELARAGRTIARGRTTRPWLDVGAVVLRDAAGAPVAARPGDVVRATLDGAAVEVPVAGLTASVGSAMAIVGTAPPGAALELVRTSPLARTTADASGRYRFGDLEAAWLDGALPRPGTDLAVIERLPNGHVRRARLVGPTVVADIGTRTISGQAAAGSAVTVARGADVATTTADATDRYTATLPAASAVLTGSDVVTLTVGAWSTALALVPLEAAFDAAAGRLAGRTAADSVAVSVWAGAAVEPERWFVAADADDGAWSVDVTAPAPGAAPLAPAAVRRIEAAVRLDGHAVRWVWTGPP